MQELEDRILMLVQLGNSPYFAGKEKTYYKVICKDGRLVLVGSTMRDDTRITSETPIFYTLSSPKVTRAAASSISRSEIFGKALLKALLSAQPYSDLLIDQNAVHLLKTDIRITTDIEFSYGEGTHAWNLATLSDVYRYVDEGVNVFVLTKGSPAEFVIRKESECGVNCSLWRKLNV